MRLAMVVLAITLAGCGDDHDGGVDGGVDMAMKVCATECPPCPSGTVCVTDPTHTLGAACLRTCVDQAECGPGFCTQSTHLQPTGRYCVHTGAPDFCDPAGCHDTDFVPYCADATTLVTPDNFFCGSRYVHCSNGCSAVSPDADAGLGGHCN